MSGGASKRYDVAVVGAGPVGSLCALAHARKGARVALLEANPKASGRLAGEWLHPPAVRILRDIGVEVDTLPRSSTGKGFVVFPEDGSEPIVLPYLGESRGLACDHAVLVSKLREAVENQTGVDFILRARVNGVEDERLTYAVNGADRSLDAARIIGADGRASVVRQSLGLSTDPMLCSRMLGITLNDVGLPFEGFGHVVLGGPGPILVYGLAGGCVRIIVDVPLDRWSPRDRVGFLSEAYAGLLPEPLGPAFVEALRAGDFEVAANRLRPRVSYGSSRRVLIGDAAGHYHPMTAVGMTLGFGDALALAEGRDFRDFAARRFRATSSPEFLAMGLYEVFADHRAESVALRQAIYRSWRAHPGYRDRTTRILACEDRSAVQLGLAFCSTTVRGIARGIPQSRRSFVSRQTRDIFFALAVRLWWLLRGVLQLHKAKSAGREQDERARDTLARAFLASMSPRAADPRTVRPNGIESPDAGPALKNAAARLLGLQREDGAWEGEMVWCPMLTAQYVLLHHIVGRPLEPGRRRRVLRSFERTRLAGGTWGLHEHSPPHLFVTALVYVAARLLGVERDDPLVEPARRFIRAEGILGIPSWGKFWLALLNLYDWRGVNAVLPELWSLPRRIPLHPSNWYCHTRLIYMAMAAIYSHRFQAPVTPAIASLREELFPEGFAEADFSAARNRLRDADLYARPSVWLRAGYGLGAAVRQGPRKTPARPVYGRHRRANRMGAAHHQPYEHLSGQRSSQHPGPVAARPGRRRHAPGARTAGRLDLGRRGARGARRRGEKRLVGYRVRAAGARCRTRARRCRRRPPTRRRLSARQSDRCQLRRVPRGLPVRPEGRLVLCRGVAWLAGERLHRGSGARDRRRPGRKRGHGRAGRCRRVHAARPEPRRRFRQLRGAALGFRSGMAESGRDVRGLDDRAVLRGVHRVLSRGARRLPGQLSNGRGSVGDERHLAGRCLAARDPGERRVVARRLGRSVHIRHAVRDQGPSCRRRPSRRPGAARGLRVAAGPPAGRRGMGRAPQRLPHRPIRAARGRPGHSDRVGPDRASRGGRAGLDGDFAGCPVPAGCAGADGAWPRQDMAGVFFRTALLDYVLYRQYFPLHALGLYERRRRDRQGLAAPCSAGATPSRSSDVEVCGRGRKTSA